jgi:hypothetical protein
MTVRSKQPEYGCDTCTKERCPYIQGGNGCEFHSSRPAPASELAPDEQIKLEQIPLNRKPSPYHCETCLKYRRSKDNPNWIFCTHIREQLITHDFATFIAWRGCMAHSSLHWRDKSFAAIPPLYVKEHDTRVREKVLEELKDIVSQQYREHGCEGMISFDWLYKQLESLRQRKEQAEREG